MDERSQSQECRQAVKAAITLALTDGDSADHPTGSLGDGWAADEALAIALYAALTADSFAGGVRRAVNHDGDSTTTGAITGAILGTLLGAHSIPDGWVATLELRQVIEQIADDVVGHTRNDNVIVRDGSWPQLAENESGRYPGW